MAVNSNELKARITGDITDLKAKLSQADKLLSQYSNNIKNVQAAIRKSTSDSQKYERQIAQLNQELKDGAISEERFEQQNKQLTSSFQKSQKETRDFQRELDRLEKEQKRVTLGMERLNRPVKDYPKSIDKATKATGSYKKGQVNATAAATSFGQVLQDAPYGIQGVANNIQQLTAQFGYLQKSTGGTKSAVKALLASFTGPAGILIAVSAVTAGLTALSNSGVKLSDILRFISGESSKAAKAQRELAESYREGTSEARAQVQTVISLVGVLQDENSTRREQLRAYNKINELNPELLRGLSLQQAATADLTDEIDKLTQSLVRQAKIQGVQDTIAKKYEEIAEKAQQAGIDTAGFLDVLQAFVTGGPGGGNFVNRLEIEGIKTATEDIKELEKEAEGLERILSSLIEEDIIEEGAFTETSQNLKDLAKQARGVQKSVNSLSAQGLADLDLPEITAPTAIEIPIKLSEYELEEYYRKLDAAQARTKLFADAVSASMGVLANQISEKLSTGNEVIDAFVASLIQGLARMAAAFIEQQVLQKIFGQVQIQTQRGISTANAITAATAQAAALGPAGFIALPGLISGAVAQVQGAFAAAQTFNDGGIIGGGNSVGDRVPILANAGEMVLQNQQQRRLFSMLDGNIPMAGKQAIEVLVEGKINGDTINLASERSYRKRARRN